MKIRYIITAAVIAMITVSSFVINNQQAIPVTAGVNETKTIILDAGHGGIDSGCVGINGELEKDINLAIVRDLSELLRFAGYNVILTRDADVSIHDGGVEGIRNQKVSDMNNRKKIVDANPNGIFISVHQNLYTEPQYFGAQMFYTQKNPENMRLAQIMRDRFRVLQPNNDREIKIIDNNLFLFKDTVQPALLIECGFLSNPEDAANLSNTEYQKKIAFTIFSGLNDFLPAGSPGAS
jgi:N-acetylmuramoyl-L-alanine amidase